MEADLKAEGLLAEVIKADRKNMTDTDIAVMNAIKALDEEEIKEKAALQLEEKKEKAMLAVQDKKVVSMKQAAKDKAERKKATSRLKLGRVAALTDELKRQYTTLFRLAGQFEAPLQKQLVDRAE
jgi:hypothetical protein